MSSDQLYLLGALGAGIVGLVLLIYILGNLVGIGLAVLIGFGIGLLSERIFPSPLQHGRAQATALGVAGTMVGQLLFGKFGPQLFGVAILPALAGAIAVSALLRYRVMSERSSKMESYKGDSSDPLILAEIDDYRLIRHLGSGGFARVYQAVPNLSLNEKHSVAIKVFSEAALESDDFKERVEREVATCQSLDHPNIVKIHKSGEQDGRHFLVMEFVQGETLSSLLRKGPLPVSRTVELLTQLAAGLSHAHQKSIIHRDIKPDNVILTSHGPKIMDFGLARLEGATTITQTGIAIGSPHYMSPEQGLGERELDGRCDQYALGVVAFEMLTGEKLFEGDQPVQIVVKQVKEPPRSPSALRPEVPDQLSRIVLRMLSKKREDRFASMDQVVAQLKQLKL